ncbi:hypothetical protein Aduo_004150 [Ancylostoma duodenale]
MTLSDTSRQAVIYNYHDVITKQQPTHLWPAVNDRKKSERRILSVELPQITLAKKSGRGQLFTARGSSIRAFAPPTAGVHSNVVVRRELNMLQLQYFNDEYDCDKK